MEKLKFSVGVGVSADKYRREPRYRCRECQDSGWVTIWHPSTLEAASGDTENKWKRVLVRCCCSALGQCGGELPSVFTAGSRAQKSIPVFGEQDWHINANKADAKAAAAMYEHKGEGYNDAFAEYDTAAG